MMDDTLQKKPVNRIRLNARELKDAQAGFQPLLAQVVHGQPLESLIEKWFT